MGRQFGRLPSELLLIADQTVAYAVDTAATFLLTQTDREHEEIIEARKLEANIAVMVGGAKPQVKWETVEEW